MQLSNILKNIEYTLIKGNTETEISDVIYDSRKVTEGTVFVALKGYNVDGVTTWEPLYTQIFINEIESKIPDNKKSNTINGFSSLRAKADNILFRSI